MKCVLRFIGAVAMNVMITYNIDVLRVISWGHNREKVANHMGHLQKGIFACSCSRHRFDRSVIWFLTWGNCSIIYSMQIHTVSWLTIRTALRPYAGGRESTAFVHRRSGHSWTNVSFDVVVMRHTPMQFLVVMRESMFMERVDWWFVGTIS